MMVCGRVREDDQERIAAVEHFVSGQDAFIWSCGAYSGQRGRSQWAADKRDRNSSKSRGSSTRMKSKVFFAGGRNQSGWQYQKEGMRLYRLQVEQIGIGGMHFVGNRL